MNTQQRERIVRKGSLWRTRSGDLVRVQFRRGAYVAYLLAGSTTSGGVLPYQNFIESHEWVAGR